MIRQAPALSTSRVADESSNRSSALSLGLHPHIEVRKRCFHYESSAVTLAASPSILKLVGKFCAEFEAYANGHPAQATLVQKTREIYREFYWAIRATAPLFIPFDDKKQADAYAKVLFPSEAQEYLENMYVRVHNAITFSRVQERISRYVCVISLSCEDL